MQHFDSNPLKRPKLVSKTNSVSESNMQLTAKEQAQIKEVFDLFDTDGGNSIDSEELDAAMFALGFRPDSVSSKKHSSVKRKDEVTDLLQMDHIDVDGSKSITLEEFTALMQGDLTCNGPLDQIWTAFSVLSQTDKSLAEGGTAPGKSASAKEEYGSVTLDGLKRACREFNIRMSGEELRFMMEEVDTDKNGSVDRDEFMSIMYRAPWF